jgi:4-aminobutyrate--pyruvate transaminase
VADKAAKTPFDPAKGVALKLSVFAEEEGLIVRPLPSDRFALCPPLVITEAEIGELFDRLERGLAKTLDWARSEKLI